MSQAIAAIGQIHLAGEFQKLFDKYKIKTGQILISRMIRNKEEEL